MHLLNTREHRNQQEQDICHCIRSLCHQSTCNTANEVRWVSVPDELLIATTSGAEAVMCCNAMRLGRQAFAESQGSSRPVGGFMECSEMTSKWARIQNWSSTADVPGTHRSNMVEAKAKLVPLEVHLLFAASMQRRSSVSKPVLSTLTAC